MFSSKGRTNSPLQFVGSPDTTFSLNLAAAMAKPTAAVWVLCLGVLWGVAASSCPYGSFTSHLRNKCYHILPVGLHFEGASITCATFGGTLVSIRNWRDNEIIQERTLLTVQNKYLKNKKFWLGASDSQNDGRWKWVDGSFLNYTKWAKNEPSGKLGYNCIAMDAKTGRWHAEKCRSAASYVCEADLHLEPEPEACPTPPTCPPCPTCPSVPDTPCPPVEECPVCPTQEPLDWVQFGRFYYYLNKGKKNWTEAENWCRGYEAHLTSILSKSENDFLAKMIEEKPATSRIAAWIGAYTPKETMKFTWTDGSLMEYTNWFGELEIDENPDGNCGELLLLGEGPRVPKNGWWPNYCNRQAWFVCKKPASA
ncbi:hypothetical protein L596_015295 [Steinernema carpocapsae]|uniref:C-type lectin domain-containing protein n=1 Tax=Steinernema carpocapsae TaxID=34508 RepID=A0A4U5NEJ3_STECR|nr:hypothetical protein L596_015295 [Steinernema carpocapsae]